MTVTRYDPLATLLAADHDAPARPAFCMIEQDGSLTAAGEEFGIDIELAKGLYRDMAIARRFDHEALALQRQGALNLWLMSWGQEAAQVGSVRALRRGDMVFPSYREHAAALCRGLTPAELMSQWRGVSHSGWDPQEHRFHIYSLVLGTQTLHATGYAAGASLEGSDEVVAVYFGDGAASQGDVNEALNWAAVGSLPVLFICQNNQWAISTPTQRQMKTPLHERARGFGLNSFHVDGNDVMAVYTVTQYACERIRQGDGPAFIEAMTYRFGGHSSSDDPTRYRSETEVAAWRARDPLPRLETYLRHSDVSATWFESLAAELDVFAVGVREACSTLTAPDFADLFELVYAETHPVVTAERAAHLEVVATIEAER
jgi:2-oxoisovalerate dehydrogenase E1 component alpha subunit